MSKKNEMFRMTWKEIEQSIEDDPVVIIPIGSTEQQGPHTPTGDYRAVKAVAAKVAEVTGSLAIPTIPFGYSEYFRNFPGTITLSAETLISVLLDTVRSLSSNGFKHIIFFNGHGGNAPIIDQAARIIRKDDGLIVPSLNIWDLITIDIRKEIYGEKDLTRHGAEPMTSLFLYLEADDMRMDLAENLQTNTNWQNLKIKGLDKAEINGVEGFLYSNMEDISTDGVFLSPNSASAERGKYLFEKVVEKASIFVNGFKNIETLDNR